MLGASAQNVIEVQVDRYPGHEDVIVERKFVGTSDGQWAKSPYNLRSRMCDEDARLRQAARQLILSDVQELDGVRYELSHQGAVQHYESLFSQAFRLEMVSGRLGVTYVDPTGFPVRR